jgi:dihydrofolate synthase/folylpolyglutamate synthase
LTYDEALSWLSGLGIYGIKLDLHRIEWLCRALGHPERACRTIHVTGTNGKGSTAHFTRAILTDSGHRVGLFTSPHLLDIRERFIIDEQPISKAELAETLTEIRALAEQMDRIAEVGIPTEFEVKTAAAFLWFARRGCDFAVVEVGMGGRLDCTNVVEPEVSVITNVALDHADRLGDTVAKIAWDKGGVIKRGRPVVTAAADKVAVSILRDIADCADSEFIRVGEDEWATYCHTHGERHSTGQVFRIVGPHGWSGTFETGLLGVAQVQNAATAAAVAVTLRERGMEIEDRTIGRALARIRLPGRFQVYHEGHPESPDIVLDAAHNPAAAEQLVETMRQVYPEAPIIAVVGMSRGHDPEAFLDVLAPAVKTIVVTRAGTFKPRPVDEVAECARRRHPWVMARENPEDAVSRAVEIARMEARTEDARAAPVVLATGSFFLLEEVVRYLAHREALDGWDGVGPLDDLFRPPE